MPGIVSLGQLQVMSAIENCRSAVLGGHVERCQDLRPPPDRVQLLSQPPLSQVPGRGGAGLARCPRGRSAAGPATSTWSSPCRPRSAPSLTRNKAWSTTCCSAPQPRRCSQSPPIPSTSALALAAVLHSWGSAMTHHPHLHMIVPGGGISLGNTRWVSCRSGFLLPVRVLSRLFRRLFLTGLRRRACSHPVGVLGDLDCLRDRTAFYRPSRAAAEEELVRLRQAALRRARGGARLSRPLHPPRRHLEQPASSVSTSAAVTFRYKDYRHNGRARYRTMTLAP